MMPDNWALAAAVLLAAYLLGCLTTGYYVVRLWTHDDVRSSGSGSVGATNAGRALGWPGFALTLICDVAKGALAVALAQRCPVGPVVPLLALLLVVAGHIWPIQLGFRGGKGIAPGLGAWLAYDPGAVVVLGLLAALALVAWRRPVFAGLVGLASTPLALFCSDRFERAAATGFSLMAALILVAHRRNIRDELGQLGLKGRGCGAGREATKD